jgi:hypothetical protein
LEITITISAPIPLLGSNVASMRDCNITSHAMKSATIQGKQQQCLLYAFKIKKTRRKVEVCNTQAFHKLNPTQPYSMFIQEETRTSASCGKRFIRRNKWNP